MIPCTDFIPAYSELFKFLDKQGGKAKVLEFWNYLSDNFLDNLRDLASKHGLRGCWMYWSKTLNEEAADFTMEMDEDQGVIRTAMHHCPSKGRLLELKHITPYPDYCGHCDVLYSRVLAPLGLDFKMDLSHCDEARCSGIIRRMKK